MHGQARAKLLPAGCLCDRLQQHRRPFISSGAWLFLRRHEEPRLWSHVACFRDIYYTPTLLEFEQPERGPDSDVRIDAQQLLQLLKRTLRAVVDSAHVRLRLQAANLLE